MNGKCIASFLCSLAFSASSAFAEIPETAWIVTEPASSGGAATIEDGTGWKFSLTANGIFTKSAVGTATALNFRTMNLECGYQITTIQQSFLDGNTVVEELYFPSTLEVIKPYAFSGCSNLRIFSMPENNITEIQNGAFQNCSKLEELPVGNKLTTVYESAFRNCTVAKAPTGVNVFPASCVTFSSGFMYDIAGCAALTSLYLGADDKTDVNVGNAQNALQGSGVREIVFGAGMTKVSTGYRGMMFCYTTKALTSVVIRNPEVFALGGDFNDQSDCSSILTYDIAGWITGKAAGKAYATRYLVNRSVANWATWAENANNYTLWGDCTPEIQQKYWDAHNGGVVGDDPPFALTKSATLEGLTFFANYWVKFNKETAKAKTMTVHVDADAKDYPSADPARFPDYSVPCGTTSDMEAEGYTFPLNVTAPEYIAATTALSNNLYRIVGGELEELDFETLEYGHYATIEGASYTFDPGRNGTWRLRWDTVLAGASITIDDTKIQGLGSVSFDKVPDVQIGLGYYAPDTVVRVTAVPAAGGRFVRWFGDCPAGEESSDTITVTMDAGKTLQPWFEPSGYVLTTTPFRNPDGASVTAVPKPDVNGKYQPGTMVTLTANDGDPAHPFRMWGFQDGLSHPDYTNRTITVCVEQDVNVRPIYAYDWFYDGTYVIDGGWKIKVSGLVSETQIQLYSAPKTANWWDFAGDHELDMKKPILDANGKEYTFCKLTYAETFRDSDPQMIAQIETIRFGRDQTAAGYRTFFNDSIHPTLWEISASTYDTSTTSVGPGPTARIIYFSSPSFVLSGALTGLGFMGNYKQLLRLNTKSETWRNFLDDPAKVTRWSRLSPETRALFDPSYFGLSAGYHPYGLTADGNGVFKARMWVEPDRKPGLVLMVR